MPQTITVYFDCAGLESIISELKLRPQAAQAVMGLIRDGRHRELFTLASDQQEGHLALKFVATDLLRFMLAAHDC